MKTFKLTIILLFVTLFASADISTNERNALLALYNTTNGSEWVIKWDLNASINTWHGVVIENDKVIALDLSFNNLEGVLPIQIGDLESLKTLNFFVKNH